MAEKHSVNAAAVANSVKKRPSRLKTAATLFFKTVNFVLTLFKNVAKILEVNSPNVSME